MHVLGHRQAVVPVFEPQSAIGQDRQQQRRDAQGRVRPALGAHPAVDAFAPLALLPGSIGAPANVQAGEMRDAFFKRASGVAQPKLGHGHQALAPNHGVDVHAVVVFKIAIENRASVVAARVKIGHGGAAGVPIGPILAKIEAMNPLPLLEALLRWLLTLLRHAFHLLG